VSIFFFGSHLLPVLNPETEKIPWILGQQIHWSLW
jgi:hypothetical protein